MKRPSPNQVLATPGFDLFGPGGLVEILAAWGVRKPSLPKDFTAIQETGLVPDVLDKGAASFVGAFLERFGEPPAWDASRATIVEWLRMVESVSLAKRTADFLTRFQGCDVALARTIDEALQRAHDGASRLADKWRFGVESEEGRRGHGNHLLPWSGIDPAGKPETGDLQRWEARTDELLGEWIRGELTESVGSVLKEKVESGVWKERYKQIIGEMVNSVDIISYPRAISFDVLESDKDEDGLEIATPIVTWRMPHKGKGWVAKVYAVGVETASTALLVQPDGKQIASEKGILRWNADDAVLGVLETKVPTFDDLDIGMQLSHAAESVYRAKSDPKHTRAREVMHACVRLLTDPGVSGAATRVAGAVNSCGEPDEADLATVWDAYELQLAIERTSGYFSDDLDLAWEIARADAKLKDAGASDALLAFDEDNLKETLGDLESDPWSWWGEPIDKMGPQWARIAEGIAVSGRVGATESATARPDEARLVAASPGTDKFTDVAFAITQRVAQTIEVLFVDAGTQSAQFLPARAGQNNLLTDRCEIELDDCLALVWEPDRLKKEMIFSLQGVRAENAVRRGATLSIAFSDNTVVDVKFEFLEVRVSMRQSSVVKIVLRVD